MFSLEPGKKKKNRKQVMKLENINDDGKQRVEHTINDSRWEEEGFKYYTASFENIATNLGSSHGQTKTREKKFP